KRAPAREISRFRVGGIAFRTARLTIAVFKMRGGPRQMTTVETIWGEAPRARVKASVKRARPRERGRQMSLAEVVTWGGRRAGAGRKPAARRKVDHAKRADHATWCPVHITLRRAKGLPSLRSELLHRAIRDVVELLR